MLSASKIENKSYTAQKRLHLFLNTTETREGPCKNVFEDYCRPQDDIPDNAGIPIKFPYLVYYTK